MTSERQYCTFFANGHLFGIEVHCVQEVIQFQNLTRVPLAPPMVRGLMNLRGQIVTAIDLRRRLSMPERPPEVRPLNVVLRTEDGAVSLLVDDIGDVMQVADLPFEEPPATLPGSAREVITGAYMLPDRLMLVLDPVRTVMLPTSDAGPAGA
jgi:purine-binding chemotaxis protein CheW